MLAEAHAERERAKGRPNAVEKQPGAPATSLLSCDEGRSPTVGAGFPDGAADQLGEAALPLSVRQQCVLRLAATSTTADESDERTTNRSPVVDSSCGRSGSGMQEPRSRFTGSTLLAGDVD
jgi:hypothetical protein